MTTPLAGKTGDTHDGTDRRSVTLLFIGLMITMLLASLNQTVLSTALPTIVGELHGVDQMTWVITAYILASTIVMPVYGKISDLLGRKPVLLTAIGIFLAGSVVGALAGDITWLIFGRVLQGLGGGGLMILSQAAIADVVPARERGKYMGFMGAVFAVSSVAGPLLGGWLTEGPGWRWAFWGNLPLGALAIVATIAFLKLPAVQQQTRPRMDYLGMALIAGATTALVLVCTWGGHTYDWMSPQILGLAAAAVALAVAFVVVEKRAENPIMPMELFSDRNFNLTTIANVMIGVAMFGALGYMPTYIQMVTGVTATVAGMLMIPMMGGLLITSIAAGQAVSRSGRYKIFPVAGSIVMGVGLVLIASLHITTPTWVLCAYLAVFGVGIGLSLQILTLIVQNSFPAAMVGTATAANNYFRQVGATLGSAIVGSIFASRLATLLAERLGGSGAGGSSGRNDLTPAAVTALPDAIRIPIIESYYEALLPIFLFFVPLAAIALVALLFLTEKPLATEIETELDGPIGDPVVGALEPELIEDPAAGSALTETERTEFDKIKAAAR